MSGRLVGNGQRSHEPDILADIAARGRERSGKSVMLLRGAEPKSSTLCQERRTASLIVLQRRSLLGFWERGAQNRGKERHLVDPRRQLGDELFQAVVQ